MESTREIAKRTYDEQVKNGMIPHTLSWHLWKRAFDIAEIEFNKREVGKNIIERSEPHLPLGDVSGAFPNVEEINKEGWKYYLENGVYFHSDIAFSKGALWIINKINDR
jgi:hypothetical protein